jgi:hypothetical protein
MSHSTRRGRTRHSGAGGTTIQMVRQRGTPRIHCPTEGLTPGISGMVLLHGQRSSRLRSQLAVVAAASYVLVRKVISVSSGFGAVRTTS